MAQLVKLLDYISRYESNPFHYPAQYIRLKRENWKKLYNQWDMDSDRIETVSSEGESSSKVEDERGFTWNPFKKEEIPNKETSLSKQDLPTSKKELTYYFLNKLYPLQLKWATSTISHNSFTKQDFEQDEKLKYFLQRFPDIYLVMYYPIFNIKKAPIDSEIIMISPLGIEIIVMPDLPVNSTAIVTDDRVWTIEQGMTEKRIISPLISLKRTEQIVKGILNKHDLSISIEKTVLVKNNRVIRSRDLYQTNLVDVSNYEAWFTKKRALSSPLKSNQLKVMDALLKHCQTTAIRRPEWTEEPVTYRNVTDEDM